jgi:hypothetical protein
MTDLTREQLNKIHRDLDSLLTDIKNLAADPEQNKDLTLCFLYQSAACKALAVILKEENDPILCNIAVTKWLEIYGLFQDSMQDPTMPDFTLEMFLEKKEALIKGLCLMTQTLDQARAEIEARSMRDKFKTIATSREWAKGLSKEATLAEIDRLIKYCEDVIENLICKPEAVQDMFVSVGEILNVDKELLNPERLKSAGFRQSGIRVHDELLQELKAWQKELGA